jgi:nucleoside-diphosphate-sugar epimerase
MFIGFGDLAKRALPHLLAIADVIGVSRRPERLPDALSHGVYGDYGSLEGLANAAEIKPDYLIFTPVPGSRDVEGYQKGYAKAAENIAGVGLLSKARRAIFVSSTRVYAERSGGWIDEDSPLAVGDPFVDALLSGEACFRRHANTTVVRPSGLYDGANPIMLRPILEGLSSRIGSGFTNRIHRDDAASVIAELIKRDLQDQRLPATLNLNDNAPVTTAELEAWCFQQLGREPMEQRDNQPRANRRVSNAKLQALGFSLRYPSFREGYREALRQSPA